MRCILLEIAPTCLKTKKTNARCISLFGGGQGWIRTTEVSDGRFTVCSLWPLGNLPIYIVSFFTIVCSGAGDWNRTHNLLITSQLLCQLSYTSIFLFPYKWCPRAESNHRQADFQSAALPTELPGHIRALDYSKALKWRPGRDSNPRPLA